MLQELVIENFAIISTLTLSFQQGMSAFTGETGAGKSILIDAVHLLVGGRSRADFLRAGKKKAVIQGLFELPNNESLEKLLETYGIEPVDKTLLLQRELTDTARTSCRINGRLVNTSILREIGNYLVDIHGQHDQQKLMDEATHLELLDSFGGKALQQQKKSYEEAFFAYQKLEKKITQLRKNEQEFTQRMDLLRFQKQELEEATLEVDEEKSLMEEHEKLANFQKIHSIVTESQLSLTEGEVSVVDQVAQIQNELQKIADFSEEFQEISENLTSAYYLLQEVSSALQREIDGLFYDEARFHEVETRLELLKRLKRKYGGESTEELLHCLEKISAELEENETFVHETETWEKTLAQKQQQAREEGKRLSHFRREAAQGLVEKIEQELKELYMDKVRFEIDFQSLSQEMNRAGLENVRFLIATNTGEGMKPLAKIASGGEMSRILLALTSIFAKNQQIPTLVFDEIDTGVSGRVAEAIAKKMAVLAENAQVFCITHLPQVAAHAETQLLIEKQVKEDRTETSVRYLEKNERAHEIARMLSGETITSLSLEHAKEWLESV